MEISDFKEALLHKVVLKSATTMSGERCVMTSGVQLMLQWPADNLDFQPLVRTCDHNSLVLSKP